MFTKAFCVFYNSSVRLLEMQYFKITFATILATILNSIVLYIVTILF